LQALYLQPRLEPGRELLTHRPTVEELRLQARIEPGLFLIGRVPLLESAASNLAVDLEEAVHEGGARPLGVPLESGGAIGLPDGGVLTLVQAVELVSRDAFQLDYDLAPTLRLEYTPADALLEGPDGRVPCSSLAGGELPVAEFPELVSSVDGRVVLIHTAQRGLEAWAALDVGRCAFSRLGRLRSPEDGELGLGVPSAEGRVARVATDDSGTSKVRIYDPVADGEPVRPRRLVKLPDTGLGQVVWLGPRFVAIAGRSAAARGDGPAPPDAIFILDVERRDRALRLDAALLGEDVPLRNLVAPAGRALRSARRGTRGRRRGGSGPRGEPRGRPGRADPRGGRARRSGGVPRRNLGGLRAPGRRVAGRNQQRRPAAPDAAGHRAADARRQRREKG